MINSKRYEVHSLGNEVDTNETNLVQKNETRFVSSRITKLILIVLEKMKKASTRTRPRTHTRLSTKTVFLLKKYRCIEDVRVRASVSRITWRYSL